MHSWGTNLSAKLSRLLFGSFSVPFRGAAQAYFFKYVLRSTPKGDGKIPQKSALLNFADRFTLCLFFLLLFTKMAAQPLDHALVSVYAVDMETNEVLIDEKSELNLTPASCLKLITTAAALHLLGEEMRFETRLECEGPIEEGTLKGDLYLVGGGDPCLGSERIPGSLSWREQIQLWVEKIKGKGIKRIEGSLVADASAWESARALPSWEWEDIGNYYGAGASALSFHENSYSLTVKGAEKSGGGAQLISTDPPHLPLHLQNEILTSPKGTEPEVCIYGCELFSTQSVRGHVPLLEEVTVMGALPRPDLTALFLLEKELNRQGIVVEKSKQDKRGKRALLHTTLSPPLKEILYQTNQKSINLYAEHLLKRMGAGTTEGGVRAITQFLSSWGINPSTLNIVDGSGLSRKNLISTKELVSLLVKMKRSPHFSSFFLSLPKIQEGVFAKPGSMSLVRGLAGYAGKSAFAILINQCQDGQAAEARIQEEVNRILKAR